MLILILFVVSVAVASVGGFLLRRKLGWELATYLGVLAGPLLFWGLLLAFEGRSDWYRLFASMAVGVFLGVAVFGFVEFIILRVVGMFRLGAIARVTYYEGLLNPFTMLVVGIVAVLITFIFGLLPYYTLSEDFKMYRDVSASMVLVAALAVMVYASSKAIDEEIENRTMLTLMSKPISRWQVVIGKYLGVVILVFAVISFLGIGAIVTGYLRYFDDMRLDLASAASPAEYRGLLGQNITGTIGMIPLFALQFLQVATLASISVAVATRYSLAMNVTVIMVLFIGANLTRFVPEMQLAQPWQAVVSHTVYVLPYLANFDIDQRLIYGHFTMLRPRVMGVPTLGDLWGYVALAATYALFYVTAALALATAMFRNRELS